MWGFSLALNAKEPAMGIGGTGNKCDMPAGGGLHQGSMREEPAGLACVRNQRLMLTQT